ncbi:GNAT family N-acetyltransferase, partial [Salmonella enterica subsp. enterica serovar Montevideo]|nr:GNAT family N-acetyltransferase [Salmonella enterica subsp. enterica serovar Montevideo]
ARYSDGYRELTDALNKDAYEYQSSSSANIAWNHNLLGTFSLGHLHHANWIGEIQELVVLPQMRGQKVGSQLLAWAEEEARQAGA